MDWNDKRPLRIFRNHGDVCIRIADSLCYTAETNKHKNVKQLYSNKMLKKKNIQKHKIK